MKKIKNVVALMMTTSLVVTLFAGCGGKTQTSESIKETPKVTSSTAPTSNGETKDELTDMSKKLEISWWGPAGGYAAAEEGSYGELLIENTMNVEIKPRFFDSEGYKTVRPVELASGNIPDLMYLADPVDVQQAAKQGFIMELPIDMIKKYAPTVFDRVTKESPFTWVYANYDGKNYGIPNVNTGGEAAKLELWRTDWLKNVGIDKIPETLEEMEVAFDKFVHNDPDKNGVDDTYALSGDITNWHMNFTEIFCAFGVLPYNWMDDGNGGVTYGMLKPETKEALSLLASWYQKGYIHPDMITDNFAKTIPEKFKNGQIGYRLNGNTGDINTDNETSTISILKASNPDASVALSLPVMGKNGDRGTFAWGNSGHVIVFGRQLADQPEKLVRLLMLLEKIETDPDFSLKLRIGEQGTHWDYADTTSEFAGSKIMQLEPYNDRAISDAQGFRFALSLPGYWAILPGTAEVSKQFNTDFINDFNKDLGSKALECGKSDVFRKPDTLPSAGEYYNDLKNKQLVAFAQIIMGEKSVNYLDEFIKEWKASGGDVLLEEANQMQKVVDDVYERVGIK